MNSKRSIQLPEILSNMRKQNGLTQAFVASQLNVSRSTYTYYETGKTEPNFKTLSILAKMYNISIDAFLEYEHTLSFNDSKNKSTTFSPTSNYEKLEQSEKELIARYRLATPVQKRKILNILENKTKTTEEK